MKSLTGYIGTYDSPQSMGIYRFAFDAQTGRLTTPRLYYQVKNAKCVALCGDLLAATAERDGKAGICLLDTRGANAAICGEAFCETQTACFILHTEDLIYTANYHEGVVLIYRKDGSSPRLVKRIEIAPKAGCHQVLLHEDFLLVPCLALDVVLCFDRRKDFAPAGELSFPTGSGPRHGIFNRAHTRLFIVSEHSHQLFTFRVTDAGFSLLHADALLPPGANSGSAAIRLSPDERFLYVSTRGADLITVFRVDGDRPELVQQTSSGGSHPRDFLIAADGRYLLVVNRTSNDLSSFPLNDETGHLEEIRDAVPVFEGVGIALEGDR